MGRLRRRRGATLAIFAIAASLALHHSAVAHIDPDHHAMGPVAELCFGVVTLVGAAVALVSVGLLAIDRRAPRTLDPRGLVTKIASPEPRARAGPPTLPVLCVFRN
jgi:hypothetical protein